MIYIIGYVIVGVICVVCWLLHSGDDGHWVNDSIGGVMISLFLGALWPMSTFFVVIYHLNDWLMSRDFRIKIKKR